MSYWQTVAATLLIFTFIVYSRDILFKFPTYRKIWGLDEPKHQRTNYNQLEQPLRFIILSWLGLFVIERLSLLQAIREIGIFEPVWIGVGFALIATSPMLIMPLINKVPINASIKSELMELVFKSGIYPIAEEISFRGFAFGVIYRNAPNQQVGLWIGALLTGIVFGLAHLGQESIKTLSKSSKILTVTIIAIGGILYAWLYAKWDGNLWVPIGVHIFMNLWWALFDRSQSAKGSWLSNFTRELSAILAILLTIFKDQLLSFLGL